MGSEALLQRFAAKRIELRETKTRQKTDWITGIFAGEASFAAPPETVLPDSLAEFRPAPQVRDALPDL
jgi:hypothetical protein